MRVVVITEPTPAVSTDDAKEHLRVLHDDENALIEAYVAAATAHIDGPDGWLGRAIGVQTLEVRFDRLTEACLRIPFGPVIEIDSIVYLDSANVEQPLAADQYELMGDRFVPTYGVTWPTTLARREAVRIQYQAGYEVIPAPIRAAILLMVGDLWGNRETASAVSKTEVPMSTTVAALLSPFRIWA